MDSEFSGWPDGGLLMSAEDGARWEQALQAGRAISSATQARMTTAVRLASGRSAAYGQAWFTDRVAGQKQDYHSGSVDGFIAYYRFVPKGTWTVTASDRSSSASVETSSTPRSAACSAVT